MATAAADKLSVEERSSLEAELEAAQPLRPLDYQIQIAGNSDHAETAVVRRAFGDCVRVLRKYGLNPGGTLTGSARAYRNAAGDLIDADVMHEWANDVEEEGAYQARLAAAEKKVKADEAAERDRAREAQGVPAEGKGSRKAAVDAAAAAKKDVARAAAAAEIEADAEHERRVQREAAASHAADVRADAQNETPGDPHEDIGGVSVANPDREPSEPTHPRRTNEDEDVRPPHKE